MRLLAGEMRSSVETPNLFVFSCLPFYASLARQSQCVSPRMCILAFSHEPLLVEFLERAELGSEVRDGFHRRNGRCRAANCTRSLGRRADAQARVRRLQQLLWGSSLDSLRRAYGRGLKSRRRRRPLRGGWTLEGLRRKHRCCRRRCCSRSKMRPFPAPAGRMWPHPPAPAGGS